MAYPDYQPKEVESQKLTDWFPIYQNPTIPGYYQFGFWDRKDLSKYFWYWDGENWWYDKKASENKDEDDKPSLSQPTFWRGLKTPPK
ncbi:MAG TPA: hypothetical protein VFM18_02690 [Methanosarcina sp.]|nr:hypothetical protein [Methanosarcina sp.]